MADEKHVYYNKKKACYWSLKPSENGQRFNIQMTYGDRKPRLVNFNNKIMATTSDKHGYYDQQ